MKPLTRPQRLGQLLEGDCFFSISERERTKREDEVLGLNQYRVSLGEQPLSQTERMEYFGTYLTGYMVYAVVKETGQRCVQSMLDGKVALWYDPDQVVQYTPDKVSFEARMKEMAESRKKMEQEKSRLDKVRSKKAKRKETEMVA
jgi:hypothetical protein